MSAALLGPLLSNPKLLEVADHSSARATKLARNVIIAIFICLTILIVTILIVVAVIKTKSSFSDKAHLAFLT